MHCPARPDAAATACRRQGETCYSGRGPSRDRIVVFSFFKKDRKSAGHPPERHRSGGAAARQGGGRGSLARPLHGPVNRSLNRPSMGAANTSPPTENSRTDREAARSLALETAAKIDLIESEMARDFLRPRVTGDGEPAANSELRPATTVGGAVAPAAPARGPIVAAAHRHPEDPYDPGTDVLSGRVDAVELVAPGAGSPLDEAAILFANRHDAEAENSLRAALSADRTGPATERGWLMLFEFLQQRGDRHGFEALATQFSLRFEHSAPCWHDYQALEPLAAAQRASGPVVALPAVVGAGIVGPLEQLKALATRHSALTLDATATRSVDAVGAELLLRVCQAFRRASHELVLLGAEQLLVALRGSVLPGRRDASDACWMLLLEVLRLLDRQVEYDEVGIEYCITYEVSPPSWEPAPPNIHVGPARPAPAVEADPLAWRGEIEGDGLPVFNRLLEAARERRSLRVECRQLRRMTLPAATALLGHAIRLQQNGVRIELRDVNTLVGALLGLMGVDTVLDVHLRRN